MGDFERNDPFEFGDAAIFRKLFGRANFDPATMTVMAAGSALAGGAVSALGTIAGGNSAAQLGRMKRGAAEFTATQDTENAASELAASQRQAIDVRSKANMLRSTAVATTAAGGVNAGTGSAVTNEAQIGARGEYESLMDLWQGQNRGSGLLNKAAAARYQGDLDVAGGEMQKKASLYSAMSTIAGAGGTAFRMYGRPG